MARAFKRAVKRAGIQVRVRPHDLRHTFASNYLQSGQGTLADLSKILGHTSLKTTMIYAHFELKHLKEHVDLMDFKVPAFNVLEIKGWQMEKGAEQLPPPPPALLVVGAR